MHNGKTTFMAIDILAALDAEQIAKLNKTIPDFAPGDTVQVNVKVKEGERSRVQAYEGVCIARAGGWHAARASPSARFPTAKASSAFFRSIRRSSTASVAVIRRGKVRRAKLYYLRDRRGKSARIVERKGKREEKPAKAAPAAE